MNTDSSAVDAVARLVSAYAANNRLLPQDLTGLIQAVHQALAAISNGTVDGAREALRPAVPVKRSVTGDYIVCLEDGLKFKSLKRHLRSAYKMSPEEYRAKWSLPHDYPMVAPNYAAHRSKLAKQIGLGRKRPTRRK